MLHGFSVLANVYKVPSAAVAMFRFAPPTVLGTVDQVDEEGERSWAVTLIVLAEDLH